MRSNMTAWQVVYSQMELAAETMTHNERTGRYTLREAGLTHLLSLPGVSFASPTDKSANVYNFVVLVFRPLLCAHVWVFRLCTCVSTGLSAGLCAGLRAYVPGLRAA